MDEDQLDRILTYTMLLTLVVCIVVIFSPLITILWNIKNGKDIFNKLIDINIDPEYFSGFLTVSSILYGIIIVKMGDSNRAYRRLFLINMLMFFLSISLIYLNAINYYSDFFTLFFLAIQLLLSFLFVFLSYI